jgi:hypothetical protein
MLGGVVVKIELDVLSFWRLVKFHNVPELVRYGYCLRFNPRIHVNNRRDIYSSPSTSLMQKVQQIFGIFRLFTMLWDILSPYPSTSRDKYSSFSHGRKYFHRGMTTI